MGYGFRSYWKASISIVCVCVTPFHVALMFVYYSPASSRIKSKRKRRNVDTDSSGGEDNFTDSDEEAKSPLSKRRLMIAKRGRSQLSQVATMGDDDKNDEGISTGGHTTDNEEEEGDYPEERDSDSSSGSDLDDFAGLLDGEIE